MTDSDAQGRRGLVACAGHLGRLVRGRQPLERYLQRAADLFRPAPSRDVEEERSRRVGRVDRPLAGQAKADVVLRQQHVADLRVRLGLVPAQPEQLRSGEPRQSTVSGQLDQPVEPDPFLDLGALGGRALVVPQDRGPQDGAVVAEHDEAVHLSREADRALRQPCQARLGGAPPVLGILLGPAGPGRRERVLLARGREQYAVWRDCDPLTPVVPTSRPIRTCAPGAPPLPLIRRSRRGEGRRQRGSCHARQGSDRRRRSGSRSSKRLSSLGSFSCREPNQFRGCEDELRGTT